MKNGLLAVLSGALISIMVAINGELTARIGNYPATVIIHIAGLIMIVVVMLVMRMKLHPGPRAPWYLYLGGVIGVGSVMFNNFTYPILGVSVSLALGLLGQLLLSLVIDRFGFFGMPKLPLRLHRVLSVCIVLIGIAIMMIGGD